MADKVANLFSKPLPYQPSWVGHGILPKAGIMLLGAEAKCGKSFLTLDLAHAVASGQPVWGVEEFVTTERPVVLFIDAEIGEVALQERVKARYEALGCVPPPNYCYLSRPPDMYLDTLSGKENLIREIEATQARVVIVDPLGRAITGQENDSSDIGKLFRNLDEIIKTFPDLSIVTPHHVKKRQTNEEDDPLDAFSPYRLRGSSKFFDCPDTLAIAQRMPAEQPGEWWRIKIGWQLRRAKSPEPITLALRDGGIVSRVQDVGRKSLPAGNARMYGRR